MTHDVWRWQFALSVVLVYVCLCLSVWWWRKKSQSLVMVPQPKSWCLAYASQTGHAQALAEQTAKTLQLAGVAVQCLPLAQLTPSVLQHVERLLLIVSTYGEGDAPDMAQGFVQQTLSQRLDLSPLHYALLALGSRHYEPFCAFGIRLDEWLQQQGATPCFARIDVDNQDSTAIEQWRRQLVHLAGTNDSPDWTENTDFSEWILQERQLLNPQSQGAPIYYLQFGSTHLHAMTWQAGDLVQLSLGEQHTPRDYTVLSLPYQQHIALLVRLHYRATGEQGMASGLLARVPLDSTVALRVRQHPSFHLGTNKTRPLIFIVSGTGLAGALVHLRQQANDNHNTPCWLIFGERQRQYDFLCQQEIEHYQAQGIITRLDTVFSRDGQPLRYVQEVLLAEKKQLLAWLQQGAAIYVCGSLQGMGQGVDAALKTIIGDDALAQLQRDGRYQRDVY